MNKKSNTRKIVVKTAITNIFANIVTLPINLFVLLISARILGPEKTGITTATISLVLTYSILVHFGTLNALSQRYPTLIGENTEESIREANEMPKIILSFITRAAFYGFLIIIFFSIYYFYKNKIDIALGFFTAAIMSLIRMIKTYSIFILRSKNKTNLISKNDLQTCFFPFIIILGVKYFGIYGQWATMVIVELIITYLLFIKTETKIYFNLDWTKTIKYIKIGIPIFIVGTLYDIYNTSDRLLTVLILGAKEIGIYSIATMASTTLSLFPLIVSQIMWPKIAEKIGAKSNNIEILKYLRIPTKLLSLLLPVGIGFLYILMPFAIIKMLPHYKDGVEAAKIIIYSIYFIGIMGMYTTYLATSLNLLPYGIIISIGLVFNFFAAIFYHHFFIINLNNIAYIKVYSFLFVSILCILFVEFKLSSSFNKSLFITIKLLLPIFYLIFILNYLIPLCLSIKFLTNSSSILSLFINLFLLLFFLTPLLYLAYKKLDHKLFNSN